MKKEFKTPNYPNWIKAKKKVQEANDELLAEEFHTKEKEFNLKKKKSRKIYDSEFRCCNCRKVIGEYSSKNKQRVVKSWASICLKCLKDLEKN